jgi:hypothetical protein
MRRFVARWVAPVATVGVVAAMSPPVANAEHRHEIQQMVRVVGTGHSVHLSRSRVYAGSIRFKVSTTNAHGGSAITLFRVRRGHRLAQVFAALRKEFDPATGAKGTRDLRRAAVFRGLADVDGTSETVTEHLRAGTYYAMDLSGSLPASGRPALTRLRVRHAKPRIEQDSDLASRVRVRVAHDRFHAPRRWPHRGTYRFTNRDDTLHFMEIIPVKRGTSDAEVQAALTSPNQSGPPPFFRDGPSGGNDVVSPGRTLQVTYNLPRGTYVLACFVIDEETGMPHALMGMHKVVILK